MDCSQFPNSYPCIVYNKRPKKQAVNFFGDLPCPINNITGPGTPHPIGLNKNELIELTHNIQMFRVNINAIPLGTDALTQFLAGGGATGGLIGAINALSSITVPVPIVFNSPALAEGSEIYERVCGQNFVARRNGRVSINTGRYVYKNKLYWPEIKIDILSGIGGGTIATSYGAGAQVRGGVQFLPYGALINMYWLPASLSIYEHRIDTVLGSITAGQKVKGNWSLKDELNKYEAGDLNYSQLTDLARYVVDELEI